jgi:hypothetical protein
VKDHRSALPGGRRRRWFWIFAGALACCVWTAAAPIARGEIPHGEQLVYEIRWMRIPAGEAVLEAATPERCGSQAARHFIMTVRTNAFVDTFYKVRSRIETWTDPGLSRSLRYRKQQREGTHRPRDEQVDFDWQNRLATYSNRGRSRPPVSLQPGTVDPLAALYFTRRAPLAPGTQIERPVTDGKKMVIGRARVIGKETIQVAAGVFDTVVIEPDLRDVGGVFEKSPEASIRLWLSDDAQRIPLRVQSKVVVGYFVGELISIGRAAPGADPDPGANSRE